MYFMYNVIKWSTFQAMWPSKPILYWNGLPGLPSIYCKWHLHLVPLQSQQHQCLEKQLHFLPSFPLSEIRIFAVREKSKTSHEVQLATLYRPKNATKFLPSRRRKSFWFVEKRRLCRERFLRPPCFLGRNNLHWQSVRTKNSKWRE